MKSLQLALLVTALSFSAALADQVVKPDPWKTSEYSVVSIEGRFTAYIGTAPILLDSKLREKSPKTYLQAIESFGPAFTSRFSSVGSWEWHFDDGKMYRVGARWSSGLKDAITLQLQDTYITLIEQSQDKSNKAVDSTATRVTPPASSLRSEQESRHGQP